MKKIFLFLILNLINLNTFADIIIKKDTGITTKVLGREFCERAVKKGIKVKEIESSAWYFYDGKMFAINLNDCEISRW
ncbi:MAG: hypothetical protein CL871_04490 [Cytophagia bacterium]|nr:hypothetical protein [Cytophagia bacterium]|tara:strand:- start:9677 stop:9910 length:234 start_codon:yes stop_codon:yes gene_type:complete